MSPVVRRVRPDEGLRLRALRLRALADAPSAFGSTLAREEAFPDDVWQERATSGAAGEDRVTYVAEDGDRWVGMATGLMDGRASSRSRRDVRRVGSPWPATRRRAGRGGRGLGPRAWRRKSPSLGDDDERAGAPPVSPRRLPPYGPDPAPRSHPIAAGDRDGARPVTRPGRAAAARRPWRAESGKERVMDAFETIRTMLAIRRTRTSPFPRPRSGASSRRGA